MQTYSGKNKTALVVYVDKNDKRDFKSICAEQGKDMKDVIGDYVKEIAERKRSNKNITQ